MATDIESKAPSSDYIRQQRNETIMNDMRLEQTSFVPRWRDGAVHLSPILPEFLGESDQSRGTDKSGKQYDSSPLHDIETFKAGMMSGIMPAGQPWLKYKIKNKAKKNLTPVKVFLEDAGEIILEMLAGSNLYEEMPNDIETVGLFGTSSMFMEEDYANGCRFEVQPIGSFMVMRNAKGVRDIWGKECEYTLKRLVDLFGYDDPADVGNPAKIVWARFSEGLKEKFEAGNLTDRVKVSYLIRKNDNEDDWKIGARFKPYSSDCWETGRCIDARGEPRYLRQSGYDYFPVPTLVWQAGSQDDYATNCPGFKILPDVKELYFTKVQRNRALEKVGNPPVTGPSGLDVDKIDLTPGGYTPDDSTSNSGTAGLRSVYQIDPKIEHYNATIQDLRAMISKGLFVDLFRMLVDDERKQPATAFEIQAKINQNIRILAPVMHAFVRNRLKPIAEFAFQTALKQGRLGEPPEELLGEEVEVEFMGILIQALKMAGLAPMSTFLGILGPVVAIDPSARVAVDSIEIIQQAAEMTGISSKVVRDDETIAAINAEIAKKQAKEEAAQAVPAMAKAAKDLSQAETGGDNALSRLMGMGFK